MSDRSALFNSFGDASTVFSFFPSESHKKAVHRITVGLESRCGLVMLTGEIGTGKTTLFRYIQRQKSDKFIYAEIGNPFLSPMEQVSHFCKSFGLKSPQSLRQGLATLTSFFEQMHKEGKQVVLIFDETHLLTKAHWGQILVFSNLRESDEPIVQILLVGQTELVDRLMEPGLEALNQRIGIRCELSPLSLDDTREYVRFKLESSGGEDIEFTDRALTEVWKLSGGVPRLINHACSHLLDQTVFSGGSRVTPDMVKQLASDGMYANLFDSRPARKRNRAVPVLLSIVFLLVLASGLAALFKSFPELILFLEREQVAESAGNKVRGKVIPMPDAEKQLSKTDEIELESSNEEASSSPADTNKNNSSVAESISGADGSENEVALTQNSSLPATVSGNMTFAISKNSSIVAEPTGATGNESSSGNSTGECILALGADEASNRTGNETLSPYAANSSMLSVNNTGGISTAVSNATVFISFNKTTSGDPSNGSLSQSDNAVAGIKNETAPAINIVPRTNNKTAESATNMTKSVVKTTVVEPPASEVKESAKKSPNDLIITIGEKSGKSKLAKSQNPHADNASLGNSVAGVKTESKTFASVKKEKELKSPIGKKTKGKPQTILDGELVPDIASIDIGAVAYSTEPSSRIAVLNQKVMKQGDFIGQVRLISIGKDELLFVFGNNKYRRVFGDRFDNN